MSRSANKYLRAVRRAIPFRDMRALVMETLRPACEAFAAECPEADRTAYYERFGTPRQIACDALESTAPDAVFRTVRRSRRIWIIALTAAMLIVIGFWASYTYLSCWGRRIMNGSFNDEELYIVDYDENGVMIYWEKVN
jgi:hypothetical protein